MSGNAAVSVIIPTYNRARYVGQAIESALSQTGVRAQVIVIDDGSTDDTPRAVAPYLDRIIYVRQSNQGPAAARNHGLRLAQADYVAFQDSDDYYLPGVLEALHATLAARPSLGAVQGGMDLVDATGKRLRVEQPWHEAPKLDLETYLRLKPVYLPAMLVRKERANRVDGFDVTFHQGEDVDFLIRLVATGCSIEWLHRSISCYRQHADNMTHDALGGAEDIELVLDKYFARTDVPSRLRRQEATIRYYNMAWSAWRMSCNGRTDQIAPWLTRSLAHTHYTDDETLLAWFKLFAEHDTLVGRATEGSAVWLPAMRVAAQSLQLNWAKIEALLVWWVGVWSHYLEDQEARAREGLAVYRNVSLDELLVLAQDSLLASPEDRSVELVDRFWADAEALGLVSASQHSSTVSLYLTAFGQATLARQYAVAWRALRRAVRASRRPATAVAWLRFVRKALLHASQRFTGAVDVRHSTTTDSGGQER